MSSITKSKVPLCPRCEDTMSLRKGPKGSFWGCTRFPACRGTREVGEEDKDLSASQAGAGYEPLIKMPGSHEQEAIWDYMVNGTSHIVINASPGTGKTFVGIGGCLRLPKDQQILFVAFNKHIAAEANGKLAASKCWNVRACTYHSLGFRMLRAQFKNLREPDEKKMDRILESLCPAPALNWGEWRRMLNVAAKLAGYAKNYLLDANASDFQDELERIADHHAMDVNGGFREACALVRPALEECKNRASTSIDFDDMVYLPVVLNLPYPERCDVMIVDEVQDLNATQHALSLQVGSSGRIMAVGDKRQAIYEFRGASSNSIEKLSNRLSLTSKGVREFPLTITRRCPKLHVLMARMLFPHCVVCNELEENHSNCGHPFAPVISALDDAPLGEILQMPLGKAVEEMRTGDLAICRVNKELIPVAYHLIRRGIRPIIKGRDIGQGLIQLVEKLEKAAAVIPIEHEMGRMREALDIYHYEEETRLLKLGDKAEGRLSNLHDKCDCMSEFIANSSTVAEMKARIESIFSDLDGGANAVTLGTVHRTKGLEASRVFVLAPELIPHPMARRSWEAAQERHLCWIAATRAKFDNKKNEPGSIIFCGPIPAIYGSIPAAEPNLEDLRAKAEAACSAKGFALERELARQETKIIETEDGDEDHEPPF